MSSALTEVVADKTKKTAAELVGTKLRIKNVLSGLMFFHPRIRINQFDCRTAVNLWLLLDQFNWTLKLYHGHCSPTLRSDTFKLVIYEKCNRLSTLEKNVTF